MDNSVPLVDKAIFMFVSTIPKNGAVGCIFGVIADSTTHIAFLQILSSHFGYLHEGIHHIGTVYGCTRIDRSNLIFKPMNVVDFALDIANADKWAEDKNLVKQFLSGGTKRDNEYAVAKAKMLSKRRIKYDSVMDLPDPKTTLLVNESDIKYLEDSVEVIDLNRIEFALSSLGYKKKEIRNYLKSHASNGMDEAKIICDAIRTLNG